MRLIGFILLLAIVHCGLSYTNRSARIVVRNKTPYTFLFLVQHAFANWVDWTSNPNNCQSLTQDYWIGVLKPGEGSEVFNASYRTGFLAGFFSGSNLWSVHGRKLIEDESKFSDFAHTIHNTTSNQNQTHYYNTLQYYQTNAGGCFKKHSLRAEDDGATTYIVILNSEIEIISPSGTTKTSFNEVGTFNTWVKGLLTKSSALSKKSGSRS